MDLTDNDLINRILGGDERALTILHQRYFSDLEKYAHFVLRVEINVASEYANETLFRAFTSLKSYKFKPNCKFRSWLITILRNLVIDEYRKEAAKMNGSLELEIDEVNADGIVGSGQKAVNEKQITDFLSTGLKEDKRNSVIIKAFKIFSEEDQELLMAYFNDIPHDEISKWRGSNAIATRQYIRRLKIEFFNEVEKLTGINAKVINERWQSSNSKRSQSGALKR